MGELRRSLLAGFMYCKSGLRSSHVGCPKGYCLCIYTSTVSTSMCDTWQVLWLADAGLLRHAEAYTEALRLGIPASHGVHVEG